MKHLIAFVMADTHSAFPGSCGTVTQRLNVIKPGGALNHLQYMVIGPGYLLYLILVLPGNLTAPICSTASLEWEVLTGWLSTNCLMFGLQNRQTEFILFFFSPVQMNTIGLSLRQNKLKCMYTEQTPLFAMGFVYFGGGMCIVNNKFLQVADTSGSQSISHRK